MWISIRQCEVGGYYFGYFEMARIMVLWTWKDRCALATETQNKDKIYWHGAFFEAIQLELHLYLEALTFVYEHPLSKEELLIDVLVIRKENDIDIEKNIGRIFRAINLFEFKSEQDSLTVDDYHKVMGYAYFYASSVRASLSDITISFAVTVHPKNLLDYLENKRGFKVTYTEDGICYVRGDTFDVQILESKKLSEEKNLFIRNLRSNLNVAEAQRTMDAYKSIKGFESKNVYINRLVRANPAVFKEMMELSDTAIKDMVVVALAEDMGLLDERLDEEARRKAREIARGFKAKNYPLGDISEITGLPLQEVEAL